MINNHSAAQSAARGVTLNSLKDELYSLNMRLSLAMQNHDEKMQEDIKKQTAVIQKKIDQMRLGNRYQR